MKQSHTIYAFARCEPGTIGLWQFSKEEKTPTDVMKMIASEVSKTKRKAKQEYRYTFDASLNEVGYLVIAELLKNE